jgi:hypothetical protein
MIDSIMEIISNFPRDDSKRTCRRFLLRLEEAVAVEADFISKMSSIYLNKNSLTFHGCIFLVFL